MSEFDQTYKLNSKWWRGCNKFAHLWEAYDYHLLTIRLIKTRPLSDSLRNLLRPSPSSRLSTLSNKTNAGLPFLIWVHSDNFRCARRGATHRTKNNFDTPNQIDTDPINHSKVLIWPITSKSRTLIFPRKSPVMHDVIVHQARNADWVRELGPANYRVTRARFMGSVVTHVVDLHSSPTYSITRHHNSYGGLWALASMRCLCISVARASCRKR